MHTTIQIEGKTVAVSTTKQADAILSSRSLPLTVEMELFFACLLCKKVRFCVDDKNQDSSVRINEKLSVRFRPVMLRDCSRQEVAERPVTDFPMVKRSPYIPKWLRIDFRFGHWQGEFGYVS
ncbi:MAG TPA: hypothetical protein VIM41_09725 [Gammaproteobacteria bacterium]